MAVGKSVVSVFSGPADNDSFNRIIKQPFVSQVDTKSSSVLKLEALYEQVDHMNWNEI